MLYRNLAFAFAFSQLALQVPVAAGSEPVKALSKPAFQLKRLASGRQIKIIDIASASVDGSKRNSLVLRYQSDQPKNRLDEIEREADDIWDGLKLDAEKGKFNRAIICALYKPDPTDTGKPFVTFDMQLDPQNGWHCMNDQRVGAGTPAKVAYYEGLQLAKQKEFAEALVCYDKCISLDPKFSPAYSDRAAMRLLFGHPEKSIPDCDEAIRLNPENGMAFANRGFARVKLGQTEPAIEDFTNALKFNYITADVLKARGVALCKAGKYEIAVNDFSKALKLQPNDPQIYILRSACLTKLAQTDKETADKLLSGKTAVKAGTKSVTTTPITAPIKLQSK